MHLRAAGYFDRGLRTTCGCVLATAAVLKVVGFTTSPVAAFGSFASPWWQLAVVQWEFVLGAWLICGLLRNGAWLVAVVTFAAFACVSGYFAAVGVSECGCFGEAPTNPSLVCAVDLMAVATLAGTGAAVGRFSRSEFRDAARQSAGFLIGVGAVVGATSVVAWWGYGSTGTMVAALRGQTVFVEPAVVDFGPADIDDTVTVEVVIRNAGDTPVRVVGGTRNCSCTFVSDLPVELGPGERRAVRLRLRVPEVPGVFAHQGVFWTDRVGSGTLPVGLTGTAVAPDG